MQFSIGGPRMPGEVNVFESERTKTELREFSDGSWSIESAEPELTDDDLTNPNQTR